MVTCSIIFKKSLVWALALLLTATLAVPAGAGTYYVSPSGDDSDGSSWAKARHLASSIIATNPGGGPHTVYIAPGTYADRIATSNGAWTGAFFIGTAAHGSAAPAAKGQVTLTYTTNSALNISGGAGGQTFRNLSATGSDSGHYVGDFWAANLTFDNCYFYDSGKYLVTLANALNFLVKNCLWCGAGGDELIRIAGTAGGTFQYSILANSQTKNAGSYRAIDYDGADTLNVLNCFVGGSGGAALEIRSGTVNLKNNILQGGQAAACTIIKHGGTVNLWNNHELPNPVVPIGLYDGAMDTDSNNLKTGRPGLNYRYPAILVPCVDDFDLTYGAALETELAARELKGTCYVLAKDAPANAAALQGFLTRGTMSLGVHSYSHSQVSLTGTAFSITKAEHTINVDRTGNQILVAGAAPVTVSNFKTLSLDQIKSALTSGGCTCGTYLGGLQGQTLGESLADSAGAQASPYNTQLLIDTTGATGFFNVEMVQAKALMESTLTGYTAKAFSTPGGYTSANAETAIKAAGFLGSRPSKATALNTFLLSGFNIFEAGYIMFDTGVKGANDAATTLNSYSLCEWLVQRGGIIFLLAHSTSEATIAQWQLFLNVAQQYPEITICDADTAYNTIRTGGLWATADHITYTRTFADPSYKLRPGAQCINKGLAVGLSRDYYGKSVPFLTIPDIGACEWWGGGGLGKMSLGMSY